MQEKILISYLFAHDTIPLGASLADGFRKLGWDVYCFNTNLESRIYRWLLKPLEKIARALIFKKADFTSNSRWSRDRHRQTVFLSAVRTYRPTFILMIHGHSFNDWVLETIREEFPETPLVGWWVENPRDNLLPMLHNAEVLDHYFCIHRYGYDPETTGIHFLPAFALDVDRYYRLPEPKIYTKDIVFVGSWYPKREEFLSHIADLNIAIYGPIWEKKCSNLALKNKVVSRKIWGSELVRLYNEARIVLNISVWDPARTGLNLRVFDVPATGAFLLTEYSPDLEEHLSSAIDIETFRTPEEMRAKIIHYLTNTQEREAIANRGYTRISSLETYAEKAKTILRTSGIPNERIERTRDA